MKGIDVEYFPTSFDPGNNKENDELHSYISGYNEQDAFDSHAHMIHLFRSILNQDY